jgi:hypothetical protein
MRKLCALFVCVSWLSVASVHAEPPSFEAPFPASQDTPRPRTGWTGIGVGIGGFVFATGQLATIPVCYADWYPAKTSVCLGSHIGLGIGALAVGITGLVIGKKRHRAYNEWKAKQERVALEGLNLGYTHGNAALSLRLSF